MRIMRDEPPPFGRYWNQKVLLPLGRMRTPKPRTASSQRKTCPVLGARARCTAASVSFFVMGSPTAYRQQNAPKFCPGRYGAIWRDVAGNQGKSGATPCFVRSGVAASGAEHPLDKGEVVSSILTGSTTKPFQNEAFVAEHSPLPRVSHANKPCFPHQNWGKPGGIRSSTVPCSISLNPNTRRNHRARSPPCFGQEKPRSGERGPVFPRNRRRLCHA